MNAFEHIQAYLDKELSPVDRQQFEAAMADDHTLREEVSRFEETAGVLELHQQVVYKQMLKDYDAEMESPTESVVIKPLWSKMRYAVAAAVVLLVLVGLWRMNDTNPYQEAFAPYPDRITLRSDPNASPLDKAMEAYNSADYERAIALFTEAENEPANPSGLTFYKGLSQMGASQFEEAAATLSNIPEGNLFYKQSQWYLALALGAEGKSEEAVKILIRISEDPNSPRQTEASELLK